MSARIGVINPGEDVTYRPSFYVKWSVAEDLVIKGLAVWAVPERVIQKLTNEKLPVRLRAPKQLGMAVSKWPK